MARTKLALRIIEIIRERKLTQTRAAKILGVDQPKISALMHGRLDGFFDGTIVSIPERSWA
jgi:predicted XRE-type DNA-binding protein